MIDWGDVDHLSPEITKALADAERHKQEELEKWAKENLPKTMAEAFDPDRRIKYDVGDAGRIRSREYEEWAKENLPKTMAEAFDPERRIKTEPRMGVKVDHDEYRYQTTGTTTDELAKVARELSAFNLYLDPNQGFVVEGVARLMEEPTSIPILMESRMKNTSNFLYSVGDFNREQIYTDLTIISQLMLNGYDFSNFEIDLSIKLGEEPNIVGIEGLLEYYQQGLVSSKHKGKNTKIPNPLNPGELIDAEIAITIIRQNLLEQKGQEESRGPNVR